MARQCGAHTRKFFAIMAWREIRKMGGCSLKFPTMQKPPVWGFMASMSGAEKIIDVANFSADSVEKYLTEFDPPAEGYLGGWIDSGRVYLDVSFWFEDIGSALRFAEQNSQLAIYDIAQNQSVNVSNSLVK